MDIIPCLVPWQHLYLLWTDNERTGIRRRGPTKKISLAHGELGYIHECAASVFSVRPVCLIWVIVRPFFLPGNNYLNKGMNSHDMFMDTTAQLKVRHRGFCGAQDNWARLSTDAKGLCSHGGGHTFGGIGGTHRHGNWQVDYEMAPSTGYCAPQNKYGDNSRQRHSSHYVYSTCGGARKRTDLDYVIESGV